jgi:hypothetical protein
MKADSLVIRDRPNWFLDLPMPDIRFILLSGASATVPW